MTGGPGISLGALLCATGTLLVAPTAVLPQDAITVGTRVKLTAYTIAGIESEHPLELRGTVTGHQGDTLLLHLEPRPKAIATDDVAVPLAAVTHLALSRGHGPQPLRGAWYGFGSGAAIGLATLAALCGEEDINPGPEEDTPETCSLSDAGNIMLGTAALSVVGGAVGLVAGTLIGGELWKPVPPGSLRLSLRPAPDGRVGLGLSVAF